MKLKFLALLILISGLGLSPVFADGGIEPPVPVRTVRPVYPVALLMEGTSGLVTVSILIDVKGNVNDPEVVKSTNKAFTQPAIEALSHWKFKPAKQEGKAVAVRVSIPIQFKAES